MSGCWQARVVEIRQGAAGRRMTHAEMAEVLSLMPLESKRELCAEVCRLTANYPEQDDQSGAPSVPCLCR